MNKLLRNVPVINSLSGRPKEDAFFECGEFKLLLKKPLIMGIINISDDSFSGDSCGKNIEKTLEQAHSFIEAGVDILDIGAESTRPGASYMNADHELSRLLPVIEQLNEIKIPLSIDTNKPQVMREVIKAGASMINDVRGLSAEGAIDVIANSNAGVCIMHMQQNPKTMQENPNYNNVVSEVLDFLLQKANVCINAGISPSRICLDPGFGFGKTIFHNRELFTHLDKFVESGYPILVGVSRKSFLGTWSGRPINERMIASVTTALLAAQAGAKIVRVHDVKETKDAFNILEVLSETM